jgi:hypothetical protein
MKFLKKFENFVIESAAEPAVKPAKPTTKPQAPTKPERPTRPEKSPDRIERPEKDPDPKARKGEKVSELDVAERFIEEINKKGESVKKYL